MGDLTFFKDPDIDRMMGVVMQLAQEVYVLRDRVRYLESMQNGAVPWEDYRPPAEEQAALTADRDAFVARLLAPIYSEQDSPDGMTWEGRAPR